MSELSKFLEEEKKKVAAMRHWAEQHNSNEIHFNEGPYPIIEKLIHICEAMEGTLLVIQAMGHDYEIVKATEALKECELIIGGKNENI